MEIGLNKSRNIFRNVNTDESHEKITSDDENLINLNKNHTFEKQPHNKRPDKRHPTETKDAKPKQQRGRPVPIHFLNIVWQELEKVIEKGHMEERTKQPKTTLYPPL